MTLCCIKVMLHSLPTSLLSSVNLLRVHSGLSSRWLMKMLIRIGSSVDPWVLLLVYTLQRDFLLLIITNGWGSLLSNSLSAHPAHTSPALDIIPISLLQAVSFIACGIIVLVSSGFVFSVRNRLCMAPEQVKRGERRQGALQLHMLLIKTSPHCSLCTWMLYLPPAQCLKSRQFEGVEKVKKTQYHGFILALSVTGGCNSQHVDN